MDSRGIITSSKMIFVFIVLNSFLNSSIARAQTYSVQSNAQIASAETLSVLSDDLFGSTLGKSYGGEFLSSGGWKVTSPNAMLVYDLATYISNGILEITVSNFKPVLQNRFKRHHVLSMYTQPWGEHHQIELLDTDWNLHTGYNYYGGIKLQAAAYEDDINVVLNLDSLKWDLSQTYHLKFVWNGDSIKFFRNDTLFIKAKLAHKFLLRFIFLGRDRTICGDYVTNYHNQQYPAMVGPVFSNLRVLKMVEPSYPVAPGVQTFKVVGRYANAANLRWRLSEKGICELIYKDLDSLEWHHTGYIGPPRRDFEYTIDKLQPGKHYEAKIIVKDANGNSFWGGELSFVTRTSKYFLYKPLQDTFVEEAGVVGTTRDLANMGWLYLMVGSGRKTFLQFPPIHENFSPRACFLKVHVRNCFQNIRSLEIAPVETQWAENEVTWQTQPQISRAKIGFIEQKELSPGDWITCPISINDSLQAGLNIALTASDTGWISFDSKESLNEHPELIVDYRTTYILHGQVIFANKIPLDSVLIVIQRQQNTFGVYSVDTLITDATGYFETSLNLGSRYKISFKKKSEQSNLKSISIYDAYLTAAAAVGLVRQSEISKHTADVNGDGKVTMYDALLIAKTAVGLEPEGLIGRWYFPPKAELANSVEDSLAIFENITLIGDVDNSWPNVISALPLQNKKQGTPVQIAENDSLVEVYFPYFETRPLGSFFIDFSYDSSAFKLLRTEWPVSMQNWLLIRNIQNNHVRMARFGCKKSDATLKKLKLVFLKRRKSRSFKIVIHRIQLDNCLFHDIIVSGVEEKRKEEKEFFSVYPNPFNASIRIDAKLSMSFVADLLTYNSLGQLVFSKKIVSPNGHHLFVWNGKDKRNEYVPSGIYYVRLKTKTRNMGQKILYLK